MTDELESKDSILGIIKSAINIEKFGIRYYRALSGAIENPDGKSFLEYLINAEENHQQMLEDMYNNLKEIGDDATRPLPMDNIDEDGRIAIFSEHLDELDPTQVDAVKALNFGIHIEIKSIVFYKSVARLMSNVNLKETFLELVEFENKHYEILQKNLNEIEATGNWLSYETIE
jgi:rubrerythrin